MSIKDQVLRLRKTGKTYSEICKELNIRIPRSSFSYWIRNLHLSPYAQVRLEKTTKRNRQTAQKHATATLIARSNKKRELAHERNTILQTVLLQDIHTAKIMLTTLYLGEGSKSKGRCSVTFGNSNPEIIQIFLMLFRRCYNVQESKFRCTVQCRSDQNKDSLRLFWSSITAIPDNQFYATRVDQRSVGKHSRNSTYRGVCRIDYFSSEIFTDLMEAGNILLATDMGR